MIAYACALDLLPSFAGCLKNAKLEAEVYDVCDVVDVESAVAGDALVRAKGAGVYGV